MLTKEARIEVVGHGIRWTNNILAELISQHGEHVGDAVRTHLRTAITALNAADTELRNPKKDA